MKTSHKNFEKFAANKLEIFGLDEDEMFIFNNGGGKENGGTDSETEGLLMDLPQILPPVSEEDVPQTPVEEEIIVVDDVPLFPVFEVEI